MSASEVSPEKDGPKTATNKPSVLLRATSPQAREPMTSTLASVSYHVPYVSVSVPTFEPLSQEQATPIGLGDKGDSPESVDADSLDSGETPEFPEKKEKLVNFDLGSRGSFGAEAKPLQKPLSVQGARSINSGNLSIGTPLSLPSNFGNRPGSTSKAQSLIARTKLKGSCQQLTAASSSGNSPSTVQPRPALSRMQKMRSNLSLVGNREDIIKERGETLQKQYAASKDLNFHDKYVLGEKLGEGQHASVYKCYLRKNVRNQEETTPLLAKQMQLGDYDTEKTFAVKIVRSDDQEKIIAHEREFQILEKLNHPNVVRAVEMFKNELKAQVFQVMECVEGSEILDEIAKDGAYDEKDACRLFKQVLEGIDYLHSQRVCHRDIKPSNILITTDKSTAFIADFNVAKLAEGEGPMELWTKTAGTLAFAAPERMRDNMAYSEKVDMWAAGIVLHMLLTGEHPFELCANTVKLFD